MLLNFIDESDLKANKEAFQEIDVDHSGTITEIECIEKLRLIKEKEPDIKINQEDVHQFIQKVDIDGSGAISYSQFLCGTLTAEHFTTRNIRHLFDFLDNKNEGYLTKQSLLKTFQRNARNIEMKDVENMMKELQIRPSARINLQQFRALIDHSHKQ